MEPLPWLNFTPMQAPELPKRPSLGESLGQLGVAAVGKMQQSRGRGIAPPTPKFQKPVGPGAVDQMGAPPPMARRRFPNPQQQAQLDAMVM